MKIDCNNNKITMADILYTIQNKCPYYQYINFDTHKCNNKQYSCPVKGMIQKIEQPGPNTFDLRPNHFNVGLQTFCSEGYFLKYKLNVCIREIWAENKDADKYKQKCIAKIKKYFKS